MSRSTDVEANLRSQKEGGSIGANTVILMSQHVIPLVKRNNFVECFLDLMVADPGSTGLHTYLTRLCIVWTPMGLKSATMGAVYKVISSRGIWLAREGSWGIWGIRL